MVIWRAMLLRGHTPAAIASIVMALIPKEEGGERPVAVLASTVRMFTRWLRRTYGAAWAASTSRAYVYGVKGATAITCVWRVAALAEWAKAKGLSVVAVFLDIAKAFENVRHDVVSTRALQLHFNPALLTYLLNLYAGPRWLSVQGVAGKEVRAARTIVAGDAFADLLMRITLIPDLDGFWWVILTWCWETPRMTSRP